MRPLMSAYSLCATCFESAAPNMASEVCAAISFPCSDWPAEKITGRPCGDRATLSGDGITAKAGQGAVASTFPLDVTQTAQAQTITSQAFDSTDAAAMAHEIEQVCGTADAAVAQINGDFTSTFGANGSNPPCSDADGTVLMNRQ